MSYTVDVKIHSQWGKQIVYTASFEHSWDVNRLDNDGSRWRNYWTRFGDQVFLEIRCNGNVVGTNCIYCGDPFYFEEEQCECCHAKPDAHPDDFGYDPSTGWTRGLSPKEQQKIANAKQRINPQEPPVKVEPSGFSIREFKHLCEKTDLASTQIREQLLEQMVQHAQRQLDHVLVSPDPQIQQPQNRTDPGIHFQQEDMSVRMSVQGQRLLRRERSS